MILDIGMLGPFEAPPFAGLTFPAYRTLLTDPAHGMTVAVGLFADGEPAGLALGVISPEDGTRGNALSILVTEPHRGQGAGKRLLAAFEQEMARRGCQRLTGSVTGSDDRSLAIERLLDRAGWRVSGPSSILCSASARLLGAPWLARATLPPGMEIFPWLELSASERAEMLERQQEERWIPARLNPFWNEPLIAGCSVGLRYRGRVAGWCVTYRFEEDTLRWWRLFVEPGLQGPGRAIPLLAETIRRALVDGFHHGVWNVSAENTAMMRLLQRRMRPHLDSARPVWVVTKPL